MKTAQNEILDFLHIEGQSGSSAILSGLNRKYSLASLKRSLSALLEKGSIEKQGKGKNTVYNLSPFYALLQEVDIERYFEKEIDERTIYPYFNIHLFETLVLLPNVFSTAQAHQLQNLHEKFTQKMAMLTAFEKSQDMERLAIDLSWKSSQIEGNTYSLLDTELLLKESIEAQGKTRLEAVMLLNHKNAIDFILAHPDFLLNLSVSGIVDIHYLLTKDLGIPKGLRSRPVGITGTNFKPLDNEFQINEALEKTITFINEKKGVFEKAFWALVLLSYIQPFSDGNKRTARIVSNAILIAGNACPLSYRTADPLLYKMAMLLFYEQNRLAPMRNIFVEQVAFAVDNYF